MALADTRQWPDFCCLQDHNSLKLCTLSILQYGGSVTDAVSVSTTHILAMHHDVSAATPTITPDDVDALINKAVKLKQGEQTSNCIVVILLVKGLVG